MNGASHIVIGRKGGGVFMRRHKDQTGCGAAAFGAGLLVATLLPYKLILIVVAAMLILAGTAACNKH